METTADQFIEEPGPLCIDPVVSVSVVSALDSTTSALWRELERSGACTPYQSLAWYDSWTRNVAKPRGEALVIVAAFDGEGRVTLLLPLVLRSRFSVRIGSFAGGKHANFNMPLVRRDVAFTPNAMTYLFAAVNRLRPDIDLLVFDALPSGWDGVANPLILAGSRPHTAAASMLDLILTSEHLTTHPRKLKARNRKFVRAGITLRRARSPEDVDRALTAFLAHKRPWFAGRGLRNPFEQREVIQFFTDLASRPESGAEIHFLQGADDSIVAVAATLVRQRQASLMFVSYDPASPLAAHSPGMKLIRDVLADARHRGLAVFDFGLGEATYKSSLGARSEATYATFAPLTSKGCTAAMLFEVQRRGKIAAKAYPRLLATVLRFTRAVKFLSA